jgi:hypothetical protein
VYQNQGQISATAMEAGEGQLSVKCAKLRGWQKTQDTGNETQGNISASWIFYDRLGSDAYESMGRRWAAERTVIGGPESAANLARHRIKVP